MILTSQIEISVLVISDNQFHNFLLAEICITGIWRLAMPNQVPWVFRLLWDVFSGETSHMVWFSVCQTRVQSPCQINEK